MKKKHTFKNVLKYIGHHRIFLILSLLCAAVSVVTQLSVPKLTGDAVDLLVGKGDVDFDGLLLVLREIAIAVVISSAAQWAMNLCNNKLTFEVVRDVRNEAFRHLEHLPLSYLDAHPYGDTLSRIIADADQFADGLLMGFTQFASGVLTIVITLVYMFLINVRTSVVVVVLTPASFLIASFIARATYHFFRQQSETRGEETAYINEIISGEHVVKAYGRKDDVMETFDEVNGRLQDISLKAVFFSSLVNPFTRFLNNIIYAIAGVYGAGLVIRGMMTVGELTSFLQYASQYTRPFNEISGVVTELQNAFACAQRLFDLIEEAPEEPDRADAVAPDHVEGDVKLEDVSFSYVPEVPLIEHLSLHAAPGRMIAIVGPTGCGKTTLINLLMRFYDVNSGSIRIDGRDIRDMTRASLRSAYGMVLQDTWLRYGTVAENLTMGKDIPREEVIAAAKETRADAFIQKLGNGYDTVLEEDGGGLSQGQKQLLCITRVMLSRPSMLILDEATSSIDTRTEQKIQAAFAGLMQGRTTFMVAHRLSTVRSADLILVMKAGHIIEQGTHDALMQKKGFYYNLYESQFAGKSI